MPRVRANTLVFYIFSNTDPEYERNLQFFTQHGMWEGDGCQYVIVVQQVSYRDGVDVQQEMISVGYLLRSAPLIFLSCLPTKEALMLLKDTIILVLTSKHAILCNALPLKRCLAKNSLVRRTSSASQQSCQSYL